jgi:hypothetical protein
MIRCPVLLTGCRCVVVVVVVVVVVITFSSRKKFGGEIQSWTLASQKYYLNEEWYSLWTIASHRGTKLSRHSAG